jgi:hypothetical protein
VREIDNSRDVDVDGFQVIIALDVQETTKLPNPGVVDQKIDMSVLRCPDDPISAVSL